MRGSMGGRAGCGGRCWCWKERNGPLKNVMHVGG